jgi:hypothetical protein
MLINDAGHWRRRAAAARALAKEMNNYGAKVAMLKIADDYDKLVRRAEERRVTRAIALDNPNAPSNDENDTPPNEAMKRAFPMLGYSVGVHSRGVRCSSSAHFNLAIFERFRSYRRPDVRLRKG